MSDFPPHRRSPPPRRDSLSFPRDGLLRICLVQTPRPGKPVTTVHGILEAPEVLLRELQRHCACGGTSHPEYLELRGDQRQKVAEYFAGKGLACRVEGG